MNHHTNLTRLRVVASALSELNRQVVFVGGATVSLYATDLAAAEARPTDDVDVVIEVATYAEFATKIDERLRQLGFTNDIESGVICRYQIQGLIVDVMPTDSAILGFSNRWYKEGVSASIFYPISERQQIRIFPAPYFIATKFEAFNSRIPRYDPRWNSDFEDIVYLFDNRAELPREISQSPESVCTYLQDELNKLLTNPNVYEDVNAQLERSTAHQRTQRILKIWQDIVDQSA